MKKINPEKPIFRGYQYFFHIDFFQYQDPQGRNFFRRIQKLFSSDSETLSSETFSADSETLFVGFGNFFRRIQNFVGFRNFFRRIQKLFRRIQVRNFFRRIQKLFSSDSETLSSETFSADSETLFVGFGNFFRRIQNFVGFRNFFRRIQKLFRRIQVRNFFRRIQKLFSLDSETFFVEF